MKERKNFSEKKLKNLKLLFSRSDAYYDVCFMHALYSFDCLIYSERHKGGIGHLGMSIGTRIRGQKSISFIKILSLV